MYKFQKMVFLLFVLAGTFSACKSTSVLPTTQLEKITSIKEVIRDTVFTVEKDSSFYKALLECRDGKVVILPPFKAKVTEVKGKYLKPPKVTIKDNYLQVDCYAEAQKLFAQWKDVYKTDTTLFATTKTIEVERNLTQWQSAQIWCGRLLLLLLLLIVGASFLRWRNII